MCASVSMYQMPRVFYPHFTSWIDYLIALLRIFIMQNDIMFLTIGYAVYGTNNYSISYDLGTSLWLTTELENQISVQNISMQNLILRFFFLFNCCKVIAFIKFCDLTKTELLLFSFWYVFFYVVMWHANLYAVEALHLLQDSIFYCSLPSNPSVIYQMTVSSNIHDRISSDSLPPITSSLIISTTSIPTVYFLPWPPHRLCL